MSPWLIRRVLALYPRAIRERYGPELADLLARSPRPGRDLVDVAWCALSDRVAGGPRALTSARTRHHLATLAKLVCAPLGFGFALLLLMAGAGQVLNLLGSTDIDVVAVTPVVFAAMVVPVGLLALWRGRAVARTGRIAAAGLVVPVALTVGLLGVASVPGLGQSLGETLQSSVLATLCWCVGVLAVGRLAAALGARGRPVLGRLTSMVGALVVLQASTIAYVLTAIPAPIAPRQDALWWYPSVVSGYDPGLVDAGVGQLSDALKGLPAVLTVCTVFALSAMATAADRREPAAEVGVPVGDA
ncbi:hypothetical protein ACWENR_06390 [Micromonospora sp. NPDC004336]